MSETLFSAPRTALRETLLAVAFGCAGCVGAAVTAPSVSVHAEPRIVTPDEATTESELVTRAERAWAAQRWSDAAAAYSLLWRADPSGPRATEYRFDLGLVLEGGQERMRARDVFVDLARSAPDGPYARRALVRAATLDAYLEAWEALADMGGEILHRSDLDDVDRLVGLGARGLGRVELGDDAAANRDVLDGLELADAMHYGDRDVLPIAVAELRFALGEIRRVRSERIHADPAGADFVATLELRCGGLLDAQAAYAQAVRSVDPHWPAMAGLRVGEMYRALHRELMSIPAPATSKTERQREMFFAFMHIRYRVLLEKGLRELEQTLALASRTSEDSAWIRRAKDVKDEMQTSLDEEKKAIEAMPFTEAEVKAALEKLEKKVRAQAATRSR